MKLRVAHVITDLQQGGAETMLERLLGAMDRDRFEAEVISLKQTVPVGERIAKAGVRVRALGIGKLPSPLALARLVAWLRAGRFGAVQTWMTHADLVGGLAARAAGVPVAWGLHVGRLDAATHGRQALAVAHANARLSHVVPQVIVSCSETARREHEALGYAAHKMQVIPNGFDVDAFRPDPSARRALRAELGLPDDAVIVGHVGRFHPQKDHATLIAAAGRVLADHPATRFVLVGKDLDRDNAELRAFIAQAGAGERVHLLGARRDVQRLTAGFDVACLSSSYGEAFPLVVGEAMACGVPCAVTDCGDAALMVGDTGEVAPIRDPQALAAALGRLLALSPDARARLGQAARARVAREYALASIVARYQRVYAGLGGR